MGAAAGGSCLRTLAVPQDDPDQGRANERVLTHELRGDANHAAWRTRLVLAMGGGTSVHPAQGRTAGVPERLTVSPTPALAGYAIPTSLPFCHVDCPNPLRIWPPCELLFRGCTHRGAGRSACIEGHAGPRLRHINPQVVDPRRAPAPRQLACLQHRRRTPGMRRLGSSQRHRFSNVL
jgi:hypothetical protein